MTFDSNSIYVSLGLLVEPFLVSSLPDLTLATLSANKRPVKVEVWQSAVCVDVIQLVVVSSDGGRMLLLQLGMKLQHAFRFTKLFGTRIATCIGLVGLRHAALLSSLP